MQKATAAVFPRKMPTLIYREAKAAKNNKTEAELDAEEYLKVMEQFMDDYND